VFLFRDPLCTPVVSICVVIGNIDDSMILFGFDILEGRMGRFKIALAGCFTLILLALAYSSPALAAGIRVVPSATLVTPGEDFSFDVVADGIPTEGLGGFQFRLNVTAASGAVVGVSDLSQAGPNDIAIASPLLVSAPTATRSGIGSFFWGGRGVNGILAMDNELLIKERLPNDPRTNAQITKSSALYTFAHTNGSNPPSGSGPLARFVVRVGAGKSAELITIELTDVMLLDGGPAYPLEYATGASVQLRCVAQVPSLTGLSLAQAQAALLAANLTLGTVSEIENTNGNIPYSVILAQSLSAGSSTSCQSNVDLKLNTAPSISIDPVTSPTTIGNQVVTGTMSAGATVSVTANSTATVGAISYPSSTSWACALSNLVSNNVITVRAVEANGDSSSASTTIEYHPLTAALTPPSIAADFRGALLLKVTNLPASGASVKVEQYVDANRNGVIDAGDYPVRSLVLGDGIASGNTNINGDEDGTADGALTTSLNYFNTSDLYHAAGHYLIRVTAGSGYAIVPFIVSPIVSAQQISGIVSAGNGPIPGAMVRLTDKWQRTLAYAIADGAGRYELEVKDPGDYIVVPSAYGYAAPGASASPVALAEGQHQVSDLTLGAGVLHLAGRIKDAGNGAGIAGVWVKATGPAFSGLAFSDADGKYDLLLLEGNYSVAVSGDSSGPAPFAKGYLVFASQSLSVALNADLAGQDIELVKGSVLVSGQVIDGAGQGVAGVEVEGRIASTLDPREPLAVGVSDGNGNYTLSLAAADDWTISANSDAAQARGYLGTRIREFSSISGTPSGNNLTLDTVTTWIDGQVKGISGNPLPDILVQVRNADSSRVASVRTAPDGTYRLGALAGEWLVNAFTAEKGLYPVSERSVSLSEGQHVALDFTGYQTLPTLMPATLPNGSFGVFYSQTVSGAGGVAPYSYSIVDGTLPDLLSLDPVTGVISGTPATLNVTSVFTVRSTDANGLTAEQAYSVAIYENPAAHIILPVAGLTNNGQPLLEYTATGGSVTFKLDGVEVIRTSGQIIGQLTEGPHTAELFVTNPVGVTAHDMVSFIVDTLPPGFSLNPVVTPTREANQTLSGTREAGALVAVSASGPAVGAVSYPDSTSWACPLNNLVPGNNTVNLSATDAAGNVSTIDAGIYYQPAMSFSLSPSGIASGYQGNVVLTVRHLPGTGAPVMVEQLVDINGNGSIDAGDYLVRSFALTDGITSGNINLQGDEDAAADSGLVSTLDYNLLSDLYHAPGRYLFRITSGPDSALVPFAVTATTAPQSISGTVSAGSVPLAGVIVRLADKWLRPISYVIADADGRYSLYPKQPGEYLVTAENYGYTSATSLNPVSIAAGQPVSGHDLALGTGGFRVTGQVKDDSNGVGIGGIWVRASGANASGMAMTGADGGYSLSLPAGQFIIEVAADPTVPNPSRKGYLSFAKQSIAISVAGDLAAVDLNLPKSSLFASGKVATSDGTAVAGIPVQGKISGGSDSREPVGYGVSGSDGKFTLGMLPGAGWSVGLNDPLAQGLGFIGNSLGPLVISTDRNSLDLVVHPVTAWIQGTVSDSGGNLVAGGEIRLRNGDSSIVSSVFTSADGAYRIGTYAGSWLVDEVTHNRTNQTIEQSLTLADAQSASVDFVLDVTPPSLHIDPVVTPTTSTFQTVTGTVEGGAAITVTVAAPLSAGPVSYPTPTTWSFTVTNLQEGDNSAAVTATDSAGNSTSAHAVISLVVPSSFTITASAGAGGSIAPEGLVTVAGGADISFAITPANGYVVGDVMVDGISQGAVTSYLLSGLNATHSISATFLPTITASAGANGSISPVGVSVIPSGTNLVYTIVPAPGHHVADVQIDGVSAGVVTIYAFANVTVPHAISVSFAQNPTYTITATAGAKGVITPSGTVGVLGETNQSFAITANPGYQLSSLLVDGVSTGIVSNYTFNNVAANHTIAATFLPVVVAPATMTVPASSITGSFYVSWGASSTGAVTYVLEISYNGGPYAQAYSGTATMNVIVPLTANGTYAYRVKAIKSGYIDSPYTYAANTCEMLFTCKAPASLTVPATSLGKVSASWPASSTSGVTYVLEYSTDGMNWSTGYTGTSTTVLTMPADGEYTFRIKATKSGYVDSPYTYAANVCSVSLTCTAPSLLTVQATTLEKIGPSWSASSTAGVTYVLEYSTDSVIWVTVYNGTNNSGLSFIMPANGTYTFRVKATRAGYRDSPYTYAANTCAVTLTCAAPSSMSVQAASTGYISPSWTYSNTSGVTYLLEYSTDQLNWVTAYTGTDYGYVNLTMPADGTYTFRVKATKSGYLDSPYKYAANTCVITLTCLAPSSLTVPATSSGSVGLYWPYSTTGGVTYVLESSPDGMNWVTAYTGSDYGSFSMIMPADGTYSFRVKATKSGYRDSPYKYAANTCVVTLTCLTPSSLSVPATSSGFVSTYWSYSSTGGVTYVLEYSTDGMNWVTVYNGTEYNSSKSFTMPADGTYTFRIKATKSGYLDSPYKYAANTCVVTLMCLVPSSLSVPATSSGSVTTYWSYSSTGGVTYVLEYSTDGVNWVTAYTGTDYNTYKTFTMPADGTYTFRVKGTRSGYLDSPYKYATNTCTVS
jgi:hypothetical protein